MSDTEPAKPAPGRNGTGSNSVTSASTAARHRHLRSGVRQQPQRNAPPATPGRRARSPFGSGVQFWAGFGDGGYDVWAWIADYGEGDEVDERIAQVVITMIDDDDLKQWRQPWPIGNSGGPS